MWGFRAILGEVGLMQSNSRGPWGVLEQGRGLMILLFGVRYSFQGPILALLGGIPMRVLNELLEGPGSSSGAAIQLSVGS